MPVSPAEASDVTRTASGCAGQRGEPLPSIGGVVAERYRLSRVIGEGGMGTVFEAEITSVGRRCAIKFLRRELAARSRSASRFEREARLLAQLEHDHITAVLDYGWFGEHTPFFVMEYLQGHTLRERLREQGTLPLEACLELMKQACRGMAHAHAQGVVHRDLKPDNLLITQHSDGRPWLKILDFGVASSLSEQEAQLTPTGAELGTAHYMAPEQARGARNIDARADVYALGAILYEALTGQRAHDGESYNEVLFHVITEPHVPLEHRLPGCPAPIGAVIERCLQKEAAERFRDAGELLEALAAASLAVPSAVSGPAAVPAPTSGSNGRRVWWAAPSSLPARRWRGLWGACVLAALAFGLGARWGSRAPHDIHTEIIGARPAGAGERAAAPLLASKPLAPSAAPAGAPLLPSAAPLSAEPPTASPPARQVRAASSRRAAVSPVSVSPVSVSPTSGLRPSADPPTRAAAPPDSASDVTTRALPLVTANPYRKP